MPELDAIFTSRAKALSNQARLEKKLELELRKETVQMLLAFKESALAKTLTSADASQKWQSAVTRTLMHCGYVDGSDEAAFLKSSLMEADLGNEAYVSAMAVVRKAMETYPAPSQEELSRELDLALDLETPSLLAAGKKVSPSRIFGALQTLGQTWQTRLKRTVRTGFTGFTGYLALTAMRSAKRSTKTWATRHDGEVRPTHAAMDGVTIPLESYFDVGDEQLLYPGDRHGTLNEIANCRCCMVSSH